MIIVRCCQTSIYRNYGTRFPNSVYPVRQPKFPFPSHSPKKCRKKVSHSENQFVKIRTSAWVPITWWDSKAQKSIIFFMSRKILIINAFRMNMWNTKTTGNLNFDLIVRKNGNPLGKSCIITEYVPQISINPVVLFHFGKLYHTVKVRNILEMIHIHTLLFPTNYLLLNHKTDIHYVPSLNTFYKI